MDGEDWRTCGVNEETIRNRDRSIPIANRRDNDKTDLPSRFFVFTYAQ